ncbi:oligogalacturonate-specific porin KdgM family protein [Vreelandella zhanjiangensis]|uniref:oligogalacturonate-specific porin KdgM family protein n=1 Tax=Vreelandella zhanjiangensis TaxID=1121960 RepID=UPI000376E084|nr:oligogalacturonate-specific porin KdgM family protein [Halomonas zhanjiangensis]
MKKFLSLTGITLGAMLVGNTVSASDTYFHYEHSYATENRYHGDEFGIFHQTDIGAWVGVAIRLYNQESDAVLEDVVSNSYSLKTGYDYALSPELTLTPNLETRFYSGGSTDQGFGEDPGDSQKAGARYTPGLKLSWQAAEPLNLYTQYRFDYRKVTRSIADEGEQNHRRHRIEVGADYAVLDNLTLSYTAYYYDGNYWLADSKEHDYRQDFDIALDVTPQWQLNLGAEDVARSAIESGREARIKAGFTYLF